MEEPIPAQSSKHGNAPDGPQMIRITPHGKMKPWIAFALNVFEENDRPVVLHTLPAPPHAQSPTTPKEPQPQPPSKPPRQPQRGALSNATTTIPRLVSVAEIIKREYLKVLESKLSPRLEGLHQYNEIGCLEDLGLDVGGDECEGENKKTRADEIVLALAGRNHVKQKQTPYMKISLSKSVMPDLVAKGATYQPPAVRKLTKSAKVRAKKRARKTQARDDGEAHGKEGEHGSDVDDAEETDDVGATVTLEKGKKRARVNKAGS